MDKPTGTTREVIFRVRRFDPDRDPAPYYEDYTVPVTAGMVVLDGLWYIKEHLDAGLAWRSSCRMGVCGSCGMMIQGRPTLACNTQIGDVAEEMIVVAPLPNFGIVRDLVPDLTPMFDAHVRQLPWIIRDDMEQLLEGGSDPLWQTPHELEKYLQFSYCIKCGCCMSACPVVATDPQYPGPQPLAQGYRYLIDSRDGGLPQRRRVLSTAQGPWNCHYAGECSAVCPKGVDPARAIQLMKRELVLDYLKLGRLRRRSPAPTVPADLKQGRREGIPEPPPYTVEGTG